jgi:hypothetical protein
MMTHQKVRDLSDKDLSSVIGMCLAEARNRFGYVMMRRIVEAFMTVTEEIEQVEIDGKRTN